MIFGRDGESILSKDICASYTTLPGRRMSTQSLICEAPSLYPSVMRRQGSCCALDTLTYDSRIAQVCVTKFDFLTLLRVLSSIIICALESILPVMQL